MNPPEVKQYKVTGPHTMKISMEKPIVRKGKFRGFQIEMRELHVKSSLPWETVARLKGNKLIHRVDKLKPNTAYEFRVRGVVHGFGLSDYSKHHVIHTPSKGESSHFCEWYD